MNRKYRTIEYIDGHIIEDNQLVPQLKSVDVMLTGTKRFHNCLHLILGLGKLERVLIDWISEEMDERNIIRNDSHTRAMFIEFISDLVIDGEKKLYKDQSVKNAFHALKDKRMLLPVAKGVYQVEPKYYWNAGDKARFNEIELNIKFSTDSANFKVLPNFKDVKQGKIK